MMMAERGMLLSGSERGFGQYEGSVTAAMELVPI
jgi:hypothetical protein